MQEKMRIDHATTSFYDPQYNDRLESLYRKMHNILEKRIADNVRSWDVHLNQTLATTRFSVN